MNSEHTRMVKQLNRNECLILLRKKQKAWTCLPLKWTSCYSFFLQSKMHISSVWFRKVKIFSLLFVWLCDSAVFVKPWPSGCTGAARSQVYSSWSGSQFLQVRGHRSQLGKGRTLPLDQKWRRSWEKKAKLFIYWFVYIPVLTFDHEVHIVKKWAWSQSLGSQATM